MNLGILKTKLPVIASNYRIKEDKIVLYCLLIPTI
jgi:hypothetical protein